MPVLELLALSHNLGHRLELAACLDGHASAVWSCSALHSNRPLDYKVAACIPSSPCNVGAGRLSDPAQLG